eukprot:GHVS01007659.1.p1 GENE.GHVS01007659.1~~GHVS01007659.1.p1  ORF type:complete len:123 (+),score=23.57 GHVS01007659.1:281-649(+)
MFKKHKDVCVSTLLVVLFVSWYLSESKVVVVVISVCVVVEICVDIMTRGNQRDVDRQRALNRSKQKEGGNSNLKDKEKNLTVICFVCKQTFMCTVKKPTLQQHVDARHDKQTFEQCFPSFYS